jgi:hypothetical protein
MAGGTPQSASVIWGSCKFILSVCPGEVSTIVSGVILLQKTSFLLLGQYKIYVKMTFRPVRHLCHVILPLAIGPWQCGFAHPAEILRGSHDIDSDPKLNPPLEAMTFRWIRRSSLALFPALASALVRLLEPKRRKDGRLLSARNEKLERV